ncbi:MAG: hypothetical protein NC418_02450 [Muribaculaceae bacterium]|nr:hypothetical protein [Muribaculaceae bacterium]
MKKLSKRQWDDISHRIVNKPCLFCGSQRLEPNPRYAVVGEVETLSVSCSKCGHLVFFDVDVLSAIADKMNEELIEKGQRTREN